MRLLHIEASPRGQRSTSTALARVFVVAAKKRGVTTDRLAIWEESLPDLTGAALSAKYARLAGEAHDPAQHLAWEAIANLVARLDAADALLISTPMWNFGLPYRLKHWIDLITQPGLTFSFDPKTGYAPLLRARPVTVILSSAGDYSAGPSWGRPDLASGYLEAALSFIGLGKPNIVRASPTFGDEPTREAALARARLEISAAAEALQ